MSVAFSKVKSSPKVVVTKTGGLSNVVLETVKVVSDIVGATLGPGGSAVLIERQEYGMPNMVTKDGVTVFRSLGFTDPVKHCIMEAMRDASVRTANEAGDGTTTATVLASALVNEVSDYCERNPKYSPQLLLRKLQKIFKDVLEPELRKMAKPADLGTPEGRKLLLDVARVSANGDSDLAKAVLECYDLVGDNGNVTITEVSGPSSYVVERLSGFPIASGYEESCGRYSPNFINDLASSAVKLENPAFILYHGKIGDFQSLVPLLQQIVLANESKVMNRANVVVVATGFSDSCLQDLAANFPISGSLNIYPLLAPHSPAHNGQLAFIEDVAAITAAEIFNPADKPLDGSNVDIAVFGSGVALFEANRFRSNIIQEANEDGETVNEATIINRSFILESQLANAESRLDAELLKERLAKLTGGIARLKVVGASSGEIRERKDRAEDAVMAVRGAMKHGVLPGGGWALGQLARKISASFDFSLSAVVEVLIPCLQEPQMRLLTNAGLSVEEATTIVYKTGGVKIREDGMYTITGNEMNGPKVYDALEQKFVEAYEAGILDSVPAVLESLRNSMSIATLLGTLGGAVVFPRDVEFERREAKEAHEYLRNAGESNPADERG